ncbi:MAG TPA: non-canonical purine NTP pyrophosphatase [Phycisphaerales bacterium]|nr:non-canonical purine NTP pyrophosphatase [Phycisphaerales bacterium]
MPTIVLATGNPHKVEELRAIFASLGGGAAIEVVGLGDIPGGPFDEPEEVGTTFVENARIKALSYAAQIGEREPGLLCLADDSGLEIDALGGRPGVISSHYASDGVETGASRAERDAANNARVLRELDGPNPVPPELRTGRFVCCMCLARPPVSGESFHEAILHETRGVMEGRIGVPPRVPSGGNGFGYDPLFLVAAAPHGFGKTGAELTSEEKNRLSHRGVAARAMARRIVESALLGEDA